MSFGGDQQNNNRFMFKMMLMLGLLVVLINSQKLYYLHNENEFKQTSEVKELIANPYQIPLLIINCNEKQCAKYKVPPSYPQLVFWNGPGCSYKRMESTSIQSIHQYFQKLQKNPIKPLRDFLERISLAQSFGVAFVVGTFLYIVFGALFRDRNADKSGQSKQKTN